MSNYHDLGKVDWHEQFKIRPRLNSSIKHEVIKILLVRNLIEKHKRKARRIRIYTEYPIMDGKICDVYFENLKGKSGNPEAVAYEIQKIVSKEWIKATQKIYNEWDKFGFLTDWVLIKESDFPDDIELIDKKIKQLII